MKRTFTGCIGMSMLFCGACAIDPPPPPEREVHIAAVNWLNDESINNAIVAQRTIYPYHFVPDSDELNELGEHDLNVLIRHFRKHTGWLNVPRGDAPEELHQRRMDVIAMQLRNAGVLATPIKDDPPGGRGVASQDALNILRPQDGAPSADTGADQRSTQQRGARQQQRGSQQSQSTMQTAPSSR